MDFLPSRIVCLINWKNGPFLCLSCCSHPLFCVSAAALFWRLCGRLKIVEQKKNALKTKYNNNNNSKSKKKNTVASPLLLAIKIRLILILVAQTILV